MDINRKQIEVEQLFNDTLALCKAMVKEAKAGRAVLKGSSLREVNQFLKFSQDYLAKKKLELEREAELKADFGIPEGMPDFGIPEGMPDFGEGSPDFEEDNNLGNQHLPFEFSD